MEILKNKNVLVTGGAGFIGSNLVQKLLKIGANVRATVHLKSPLISWPDVEYVRTDLKNGMECIKACYDIDYVFLCAANTSGAGVMEKTPFVHLTPNVIMNANMLEAAYHNDVQKVLFISSSTVYPLTDYPVREHEVNPDKFFYKYHIVAWMKYFTEKMCEMYSQKVKNPMKTVIVRPGNVYGPGDDFNWETSHVIPSLIRKVVERHNPIVVWGNGQDVKDFIYVGDFVDALVLAMEKTEETLNIASGESCRIEQIIDMLTDIDNYKNANIDLDNQKPTMIPKRLIDTSKMKEILGFIPQVSLRDGLSRTIDWYRTNL
jgi:GDP-L-fucose synthase